jgi:hypothetical protein
MLTRRDILERSEALLSLENTSVSDIKNIWTKPGESSYTPQYLEQEDLPYYYDLPLSMKMVHRYRNCLCRPAQFYHQIDINNQLIFLNYRFVGKSEDRVLRHDIITFMAWMTNMKGRHDIFTLVNDEEMVNVWYRKPISFFLHLSEEHQNRLLEEYDATRTDAYEEVLKTIFFSQGIRI